MANQDIFGAEITESKPSMPRQPTVKTDARNITSITRTLDLSTVIQYLASAARGDTRYQDECFDIMVERDPHLQSVLQTRRLALTQAGWQMIPGDENEPRSIDAAVDMEQQITGYDEFDDSIQGLLDAVPKGTSVAEIIYTDDWQLDRLVEIPGKLLDWTTGDLRVLADGARAIPLEPNKFIRHSPRLKPGPIVRRGLMRALSIYWCISHYAMEDWAAFVEVFGMPVRVGRYDGGTATSETKAALVAAVKAIGTDAAAILTKDMDIEFIESSRTSGASNLTPMQAIIDHIEMKMSIAVLGQNVTTQSESGTGTLAGNAAERTMRSLTRGDAMQLDATLRRDLFAPIVGFRHGFDVALPHIRWNLDDAVNTEARGKIYSLAKEIGVPTSISQFREEMQLLEPIDNDDEIAPAEQGFQGVQFSKKPAPILMDLSTKTAREADKANDKLMAAATAQGISYTRSLLDRAVELSNKENSPESFLKSLKKVGDKLPKMLGVDTDDVDDLTARTQITGDLNGRLAVKEETRG